MITIFNKFGVNYSEIMIKFKNYIILRKHNQNL